MAAVTIRSLDHVVLTVRSIEKSVAFYTQQVGMRHERFGQRHALVFGNAGEQQQKINLHEVGKEFLPRATLAKPGTADLCFITRQPIEGVRDRLWQAGVQLEVLNEEPKMDGGERVTEAPQGGGDSGTKGAIVQRTGARGTLRSVYMRDPDGNLIEVSNYEGEVD